MFFLNCTITDSCLKRIIAVYASRS